MAAVGRDQYREWRAIRRRLALTLGALGAVFVLGIGGYMLVERWGWFDATYMTVITLATVGFGETHALSPAGRAFTIILILGGMTVLTYGLTQVTTFVVEGQLTHLFRRAKMEKAIERLTGHAIVCGAGKTGWYVAEEMRKMGHPFVMVDQDAEQLRQLPWPDVLWVQGDATKEAVLEEAGIHRAASLVAALHTDRDNLFVVLTARGLNARLRIIAKGVEEESRDKLLRAGADSVVLEYFIGGLRMASEVIRPAVVSFLDIMLRDKDRTLRIEEARIGPGSRFIGTTVGEAAVHHPTGLILLAVRRPDGRYHYAPDASIVLQEGDILIVFGDLEVLGRLRALAGA